MIPNIYTNENLDEYLHGVQHMATQNFDAYSSKALQNLRREHLHLIIFGLCGRGGSFNP